MGLLGNLFVRIALVLVVLAGAGVAGWWFFVREDAELATAPLEFRSPTPVTTDSVPRETVTPDPVSPTVAAGQEASPGFTRYAVVETHGSVDGRSYASYFADETFANVGLPSTAEGRTPGVSGQFYLGPDGLDPSAESSITVDLTQLRSDREMRDTRVQGALETDAYPNATFVASSIEGWPGEIAEGEDVAMQLTGMMDLHGVQKELTWDVVAQRSGDVVTALATVNFLYEEFDVPVLNVGGQISVEDDVTLQVQLIAVAS